ncbi:MAG TPA: phosphoglycerate mutase family protein [Gaiellaceae bacterium]|nr:phosphoglycerate mutase family protein [Gaiellaceae bacterium]
MSNQVVLVRHASAGNRKRWSGDDRLRPLDERGRRQAHGLVAALEPFGVDRVYSSPYLRCVQTVEPLAAALGVEVEEREELAEGVARDAVLSLLDELDGGTPALCTHGDVVELLLGPAHLLGKGAARILETTGSGVVPGQHIPTSEA